MGAKVCIETHAYTYTYFFCYQHFAGVSLIGIRVGCIFMRRFLHIYAYKAHTHHTWGRAIHAGYRIPITLFVDSYYCAQQNKLLFSNFTNGFFDTARTRVPYTTAHSTMCCPLWALALAFLLHI